MAFGILHSRVTIRKPSPYLKRKTPMRKNAVTLKAVTHIEPLPSIQFTENDYERLKSIVCFLQALHSTFDVGEVGHNADYFQVQALVRPGYEVSSDFLNEIRSRFDEARKAGGR